MESSETTTDCQFVMNNRRFLKIIMGYVFGGRDQRYFVWNYLHLQKVNRIFRDIISEILSRFVTWKICGNLDKITFNTAYPSLPLDRSVSCSLLEHNRKQWLVNSEKLLFEYTNNPPAAEYPNPLPIMNNLKHIGFAGVILPSLFGISAEEGNKIRTKGYMDYVKTTLKHERLSQIEKVILILNQYTYLEANGLCFPQTVKKISMVRRMKGLYYQFAPSLRSSCDWISSEGTIDIIWPENLTRLTIEGCILNGLSSLPASLQILRIDQNPNITPKLQIDDRLIIPSSLEEISLSKNCVVNQDLEIHIPRRNINQFAGIKRISHCFLYVDNKPWLPWSSFNTTTDSHDT